MRIAAVLVAVGFVVMVAALGYGFALGGGWAEVSALTAYPWFNVSLVDVYVGFGLFGGWIVYRERSGPAAAGWILLVLLLGNAIACAYVLLALRRSGGDWAAFWRGARAAA